MSSEAAIEVTMPVDGDDVDTGSTLLLQLLQLLLLWLLLLLLLCIDSNDAYNNTITSYHNTITSYHIISHR